MSGWAIFFLTIILIPLVGLGLLALSERRYDRRRKREERPARIARLERELGLAEFPEPGGLPAPVDEIRDLFPGDWR